MSDSRTFLLSSFVHDDEHQEGTGRTRPAARQHAQPVAPPQRQLSDARHNDDESSDDGYGSAEVFYDHGANLPAWEKAQQHHRHDHNAASASMQQNEPQKATAVTDSRRMFESKATSVNANSTVQDITAGAPRDTSSGAIQPLQAPALSGTVSGTHRPKVRHYAGAVNTAVATMDNAVHIPSALRGAARRTMFDVLVDVEQQKRERQKHKERQTAGEQLASHFAAARPGSSSTAVPPTAQTSMNLPEERHRSGSQGRYSTSDPKAAKAPSATSSAREKTYQMLFPTASAVFPNAATSRATRLERGSGEPNADPHSPHSTTSFLPLSSTASSECRTTLATIRAESREESASSRLDQTAAPVAAAASSPSTSRWAPTASPAMKQVASQLSSKSKDVQQSPTESVAPPRGPDRRLRHLLPAHLHGSRLSKRADDHAADGVGRHAADGSLEDSISDISSVRSDNEEAECPGRAVRRANPSPSRSTKHRAATKDACLLDLLDGGRGSRPKDVKVTGGQSSPHPGAEKARTSKAIESGWLQRMEEKEYRAQLFQQQRHGNARTASGRPSAAADNSFLEDVVMGVASHRTSTSEKPLHRRHRRARATSQASSATTASKQATSTSPSHTRSGSSSSSHNSISDSSQGKPAQNNSTDSLDLMQDVDDDVPRWVRQHEMRQRQHGTGQRATSVTRNDVLSSATMAGRPSASLERERAEAVRPFIGKPIAFYPSCAAARRQQQRDGYTADTAVAPAMNAASRLRRLTSAGVTAAEHFLASAAKTTSLFFASWKEGRRLLKQNPTAVAVVEYLCTCFARWKPYNASLTGETEWCADDHVAQAPIVRVAAAASSQESKAATALQSAGEEREENGVELKIRVQFVEAAFNVAVVHGVLAWCSDDARQRLGLSSNADSPAKCSLVAAASAATECGEESGLLSYPMQATAPSSRTHTENPPWSFLFPEPALMQVKVVVGEHIYLAHPYHVYPAERIVLASYNFTTDEVVRQQEQQYEMELEERLRAVAKVNEKEAQHTRLAHGDTDEARGARLRGVSPVRASPHPPTSQGGRRPTESNRFSGRLERSPNRMVYEIPNNAGTPQRAPAASFPVDMGTTTRTPERRQERMSLVDGASPEPLPPAQQPLSSEVSGSPFQSGANKGSAGPLGSTISVTHAAGRDPLHPRENASLSVSQPLPSFARASATTSVNSLAADGFYDPLAMPAFSTAGTAAMRFDGGVALVLTNNSDDAENEVHHRRQFCKTEGLPSELPVATAPSCSGEEEKRRWLSTTAEGSLKAPPLFPALGDASSSPISESEQHAHNEELTSTADVAVRTFGSAEAVVEDAIGDGFPRGPLADWDVPVEVLYALSGAASQRASKALPLPPPLTTTTTRGFREIPEAAEHDNLRSLSDNAESDNTGQSALSHPHTTAPTLERKRARDSVGATEPHSSQIAATQTDPSNQFGVHYSLPQDVSYSFPTPLPSAFEQTSSNVSPAQAEDSRSGSISSPSDLSDGTVDEATGFVRTRVDPVAFRRCPASRVPPPGRRFGRGGHRSGRQPPFLHQQQQQEQDCWMRRLLQQPAEPTGGASAIAPTASQFGHASPGVLSHPKDSGGNTGGQVLPAAPQASDSGTCEQAVQRPAEDDATSTTITTGFYAFDDVILSDSDE